MPMVNFRSARPREPPVAKRKCRIILRNSRSRSSSHSENDAEYIMGMRKSGTSREYDIVDMRFGTSTAAMADALGRIRERRRRSNSEAVADEKVVESDEATMEDELVGDMNELVDEMLGGMQIKKEDDNQSIGGAASPSSAYSPFSPLASIAETPEATKEVELEAESEEGDIYTTIELQTDSWNDSTFLSPKDTSGDPFNTSPGRMLNDMMAEESRAWNGTPPPKRATLTPRHMAAFAHERRLLQVRLGQNQSSHERNICALKNERPDTLSEGIAPSQVLIEPRRAPVYLGTLLEEDFHHGKPMDITNMVSFPAFLPTPSPPDEIEYKFGTDPQFSMMPGTFVSDPKFCKSLSGAIPTTWAGSSITEDAEFKSMETEFMNLFFDPHVQRQPQSTIDFFVAGQANTSNSAVEQAVHG